MKLTPINGFESQIELGSDLPASGILPVKVEIHNNTLPTVRGRIGQDLSPGGGRRARHTGCRTGSWTE